MKDKLLIKNVGMNVLRVMSGVLIPLITYPYVTRTIGPEGLGKVDFVTSITNYFVLFSSLGIPSYGIIVCAKCRNNEEELKKTICELIYICLLLQIITYAAFGFAIVNILELKPYKTLFLIQSLTIFFTSLSLDWLYTALEEFTYITLRTIGIKILSLFAIFAFVKSERDYLLYAWIVVISTVLNGVINFWNARKYFKLYNPRNLKIKRHVKPIFVFFMASMAATINGNTDIAMLGIFTNDTQVGLYSFSVKVKNLMTTVITAALSVFLPRFSFLIQQKRIREYKKMWSHVFEYTIAIASFCTLFCLFFCQDILMLLGGKKYIESLVSMKILVLCVYAMAWTWTLGVGVLQPLGKEREYALILIGACVVNVGINIILIPKYQVTGAATATLITEIFNAILFYRFARNTIYKEISWKKVYGFLITGIIASGITKVFLMHIKILKLRFVFEGMINFILFFIIAYIFNEKIRNDINNAVKTIRKFINKGKENI